MNQITKFESLLTHLPQIIMFLGFALAGLHIFLVSKRAGNRKKRNSEILARLQQIDPEWSEAHLQHMVRAAFLRPQQTNAPHAGKPADVLSMEIVDIQKRANSQAISLTVCINAQATAPATAAAPSPQMPRGQSRGAPEFREFWQFERLQSEWKVTAIWRFDGWSKFVTPQIMHEIQNNSKLKSLTSPNVLTKPSDKKFEMRGFLLNCVLIYAFSPVLPAVAIILLDPINYNDSFSKILLFAPPYCYLLYVLFKNKTIANLYRVGANLRVSLIVLTQSLFSILCVSVFFVIALNVAADFSAPVVTTTKVIGKHYHRNRNTRYETAELLSPSNLECCVFGSPSLKLTVSKQDFDALEIGKSTAELTIKKGFLEIAYLKSWKLLPLPQR